MLSISYLAAAVVIRRTRQPRVRHLRATALNIGFFSVVMHGQGLPVIKSLFRNLGKSRHRPLAPRRWASRCGGSETGLAPLLFFISFPFPVKDNRLARGRQWRSRGLPQQPVNLDARARAGLPAKTPSLSRTGSWRSNLLVGRMGGATRDSSDLGN